MNHAWFSEVWPAIAAWCGVPSAGGSVALALFFTGAAGSVTHCVPMCGGFVLGQVSDGMARLPLSQFSQCRRHAAAALPGYHLGRLTVYAALGMAAGYSGSWLGERAWPGWIQPLLLSLGALMFLARASRGIRGVLSPPRWLRSPLGNRLGGLLGSGGRRVTLMLARRGGGGFPMGVALGFLPCSLVYASLAVTAGTFGALGGALAMLCFGLGTGPGLVTVGYGARAAARPWIQRAAPVFTLVCAGLLLVLAVRSLAALA